MPRILVVDDDAVQLDLKKQILETAGYQVEIALTASHAVRRLGTAGTAIVMMDLRLPNALGEPDSQEGIALIRRIRDHGYGGPVIVLCGWPEDLYGQPEELLVSRILAKPVNTKDLLDTVRDLLV